MTLSQTAIITRQIITLTIVSLIVGIVAFIGYRIWYANYLARLPVKEPIPDTKFGILPAPDFPKPPVSSSNFSYSIDTTTGNLPKLGVDEGFDKLIKVYFITKAYATLLSSEKSRTLAEKFSISAAPKVISETDYLYSGQNKTLSINLDNGNFLYIKEASSGAKEALDDDNKLVNDFQSFLTSLGVFRDEFKTGTTRVVLLKRDGEKYASTTLRTETEAAQISLWPPPVDKKPILTPDFNKALVNAVVKKTASDLENYYSLNFTFWPVDLTTFATYPLKSAEEAFDNLKSGKGIVVLEPAKPQVSITSIYLAYFQSESYSPYLTPIYVFEGPQFVAYVPAITSDFIGVTGQFQNPPR